LLLLLLLLMFVVVYCCCLLILLLFVVGCCWYARLHYFSFILELHSVFDTNLAKKNFKLVCFLICILSKLLTRSSTTTTPSLTATTASTATTSTTKKKTTGRRRRDDDDDDDDDKRCCEEVRGACLIVGSNPSHRCYDCNRSLHPPCGTRGPDVDDIVCFDCTSTAAVTASTAASTPSTAAATRPAMRPKRAGRRVRNEKVAVQGVAFELRASSLVVQRIVLDQLRWVDVGANRIAKYAARACNDSGLKTGFAMHATLVDDTYEKGEQLLFLCGVVAASMKQEARDVCVWLRLDGSLAFASCTCPMGAAGRNLRMLRDFFKIIGIFSIK